MSHLWTFRMLDIDQNGKQTVIDTVEDVDQEYATDLVARLLCNPAWVCANAWRGHIAFKAKHGRNLIILRSQSDPK